jgi:hypothetical protein
MKIGQVFRGARSLRRSPALLLLLLGAQCIAEDFADNRFTDGIYFSAIWESEHNIFVPFVTGSYWRQNWLVCWDIGSLKEGQRNVPTQALFLDTLHSPLYLSSDFRASESRNLILREDIDNHRLALYEIGNRRPVKVIKTLDVGDPQRNHPWFTRSEKYFFLQNPAATIYSVTNLAVFKALKPTKNLDAFNRIHLQELETLTDDLKYLIKSICENWDDTGLSYYDQASCYNLETEELQTITIHNGTNHTEIVGAESIEGRPVFLALWQPERATSGGAVSGFKRLGVFDNHSALIAEVPIPLMSVSGFSRTAVWDYAHSRIFLYDEKTLSEFDYAKHTVKRFPLSRGRLTVP